jgi:hypothetical protein
MNQMQHIGFLGLGGQLGLLPRMGSIVPYCGSKLPWRSPRSLREIFCHSPRTPFPKKSFWKNGKIAGMLKNMLYNIKNAKNVLKVSWGIHFTYFAYFAYFGYYKLLINNKLQMKNKESYLLRLTSPYFDLAPLLRFTSLKWGLLRKNGGLNCCISVK